LAVGGRVQDWILKLIPRVARRRIAEFAQPLLRRPVRFGSLRRLEPLSREFGFDRGQPIDRYYIERFIERHAASVRGRVLEIGTDMYTRQFGGDRVTESDVLHVEEWRPGVTVVGDLADSALQLEDAHYDCIILTQVLHFIFDVPAALRNVNRLLRPGGALLLTEAGITAISRHDRERWGDFWRFTSQSIEQLLAQELQGARCEVRADGNVLAAAAFLYGIAAGELKKSELDHRDPDYEVVLSAFATKPA
jgi:SAM-dependent methyltransferase